MLPKRMAQAILFAALAAALALGLYGGAQAYDWSTATSGSDGETRLDAPIGVDPHGQPMMSLFAPLGDDSDGDTIPDECDNCPLIQNPGQEDMDADGIGDVCDDSDGDGAADSIDNCPVAANPTQLDTDGDGDGDVCDPDDDDDGVADCMDNCPLVENPGQSDFDGDGLGDACDPDDDNDGVPDADDLCPETAPGDPVDSNGCSDAQVDADGDGICDPDAPSIGPSECTGSDLCPDTQMPVTVDDNGCSDAQVDADSDGICDSDAPSGGPSSCTGSDNCPNDPNPNQLNTDADLEAAGASVVGDPLGDACDPDKDNDGFSNCEEEYLGTDPLDNCSDDSTHDAWPLDINKDTYITVTGDVLLFAPWIDCAVTDNPDDCQRLDLDYDGWITQEGDADLYNGRIGETCD
jgi:hypothetical protein